MTTTSLTPMFDLEESVAGSGPRARKTDKVTSHIAADASQVHMKETKRNVLRIVSEHGSLVGSEINEQYLAYAMRKGWRRPAYDTPRKRAGELALDGFLDDSETRIAEGNNLPESVYRLTAKGEAAVGL
ncbi:hypothetical protein GCM10022239_03870 [Leifsonia bigeumensis]|uniref:Uncharacterized protein n=1 Tax=Leifsonella bigeumensis TaxID=433643 RepID=A0ABP7F8I7_9MICO